MYLVSIGGVVNVVDVVGVVVVDVGITVGYCVVIHRVKFIYLSL